MSIPDNIQRILKDVPEKVKLIAVSKTKPQEDIWEAYNAGYKVFGENKPQEMTQKFHDLPKDIEWHMIGHLQTNKVKYIAPYVSLIHAVDSMKLMKEIDKQARKNDRVINCLLQFHIANEETKFGFSLEEVQTVLSSDEFKSFEGVNVVGVMGMATFTDNQDQVKQEFRSLKKIFDELKEIVFKEKDDFTEISMGMSGDYSLAIEEGSTMIRVGSSIFGTRNYS